MCLVVDPPALAPPIPSGWTYEGDKLKCSNCRVTVPNGQYGQLLITNGGSTVSWAEESEPFAMKSTDLPIDLVMSVVNDPEVQRIASGIGRHGLDLDDPHSNTRALLSIMAVMIRKALHGDK